MLSKAMIKLAKEAAAYKHNSHSRTIKLKKPGGAETAARHMQGASGNAQTPFRYGRKPGETRGRG